ncbi:helix-turn-helix domain-containing protein [Mangrovibacillus sp. Mu-81]|jgi:transcriptional regulator with XRE-family HTH domain|uniref:helix-turn-helix domain-containing protein n=1 Tax=Mangrovibacillus sp. Mu-81 TaxID=3121478 RepID=UPI002FE4A2EE
MNVTEGRIGEQIKELRRHFGISQQELCKDICSQSFISRIESGDISPSAHLLYRLSMRLGIDINYFLESIYVSRMDYVQEVMLQLSEALKMKKYDRLKDIVEYEKDNPLFKHFRNKQTLLWYEAIYMYKVHHNYKHAILLLDEALRMKQTTVKSHSEKEIEMCLTKANIYTEEKEYKEAKNLFNDILSYLKQLPIIRDKVLLIKVYYNYSRVLYLNDQLDSSLHYAQRGIKECKENRILYGMGELYFQMGRIYRDQSENQLSLDNFEKAKMVAQLIEDRVFIEMTDDQVEVVKRNSGGR